MGENIQYHVIPGNGDQERWIKRCKKLLDPVFLMNLCLGLVVKQEPKLWHRICSYCHRALIIVLLLFTCIIQNVVCFRRDGFVISPKLSNRNEAGCDALKHLILSNITLEVLVIVAYTMLILYFTTWELGNNVKREELRREEAAIEQQQVQACIPRNIQRFMSLLIPFWILMSFAVRLMEAWAFGILPNKWYNLTIHWENYTVPEEAQVVLGSLCLVGFMLFDLIYTAVVVAYVSQCELVRKVVDDRSKNIQHQRQGQIGLSPQETIQNIGKIRTYMEYINGRVSWLVSVVLFSFASGTATSLRSLHLLYEDQDKYEYDFALASSARAIGTILWILLLLTPLVQAARLTDACTHLKNCACDLLEQQAANWPQAPQAPQADNKEFQVAQLYTLYLNTVSSSLKAKILGIPIHSWAVYSAMVLTAYVMFILIQTDDYSLFNPVF